MDSRKIIEKHAILLLRELGYGVSLPSRELTEDLVMDILRRTDKKRDVYRVQETGRYVFSYSPRNLPQNYFISEILVMSLVNRGVLKEKWPSSEHYYEFVAEVAQKDG